MAIKVVAVGKEKEEVILGWEAIEITFVLWDGKLVEMSRWRIDGARIYDEESLFIPPASYQEIKRRAYAILKGGSKKAIVKNPNPK